VFRASPQLPAELRQTGAHVAPYRRLHLDEKACTIAGFKIANQITRCKALNV